MHTHFIFPHLHSYLAILTLSQPKCPILGLHRLRAGLTLQKMSLPSDTQSTNLHSCRLVHIPKAYSSEQAVLNPYVFGMPHVLCSQERPCAPSTPHSNTVLISSRRSNFSPITTPGAELENVWQGAWFL